MSHPDGFSEPEPESEQNPLTELARRKATRGQATSSQETRNREAIVRMLDACDVVSLFMEAETIENTPAQGDTYTTHRPTGVVTMLVQVKRREAATHAIVSTADTSAWDQA